MSLQIAIRESGDVTVVELRGKATIGDDTELLSSHLKDLVAHGARKLLLNLTDLTQVDSSGVSAIVEACVSLRNQGGTLKILCPKDRVLAVLKVTHLLSAIPSFEDEAKALASFGTRGQSATS